MFVLKATGHMNGGPVTGAQRGNVLVLITKLGLTITLTGLVLGSALALALTRFLFDVGATDPLTDSLTFMTVGAVLVIIAFLACYLSARRATRVDPVVALRDE